MVTRTATMMMLTTMINKNNNYKGNNNKPVARGNGVTDMKLQWHKAAPVQQHYYVAVQWQQAVAAQQGTTSGDWSRGAAPPWWWRLTVFCRSEQGWICSSCHARGSSCRRIASAAAAWQPRLTVSVACSRLWWHYSSCCLQQAVASWDWLASAGRRQHLHGNAGWLCCGAVNSGSIAAAVSCSMQWHQEIDWLQGAGSCTAWQSRLSVSWHSG